MVVNRLMSASILNKIKYSYKRFLFGLTRSAALDLVNGAALEKGNII